MKIMQIVSGVGLSGAVYHCLLLSRELVKRGHEVTLLCRPGAWIGEQVTSDPIRLIESDMHRWPPDEIRRIAAILDKEQYDVVNTHQSRAHLFGVLLRLFTRVPRVATAQNRYFQPHWAFNDMVIAASESTRRFHRRVNLVPGQRIVTVHNFAAREHFKDIDPSTRYAVRESLGIADSSPVIAVVANVIPRKGQIYALRALPRILETEPTAQLLLVGDEDHAYLPRILSLVDVLNLGPHVHRLGRRRDIPELLAASDIFMLPSLEEALPLSILEAMAAGLPTVATTVGGNSECVIPRETGLLVPPRDPQALGNAVLEMLGDREWLRQMGRNARLHCRNRFSIERQTTATEAVFEQVISGRRSARAA